MARAVRTQVAETGNADHAERKNGTVMSRAIKQSADGGAIDPGASQSQVQARAACHLLARSHTQHAQRAQICRCVRTQSHKRQGNAPETNAKVDNGGVAETSQNAEFTADELPDPGGAS